MDVAQLALRKNNLSGNPFPLTFELNFENGVWKFFIAALSIEEVAHVMVKHARERLVVFDVEQWCQHRSGEEKPLTIGEIAHEKQVPFLALDVNAISIDSERLPEFVVNFDHCNFHMFDCGEAMGRESMERALQILRNEGRSRVVLNELTETSFWIDSHDDCYLQIQCDQVSLAKDLVALAMVSLIRIGLASEKGLSHQPIIEAEMIERMMVAGKPVTILPSSFRSDNLITWPVFFSAYPWRSNGDLSGYEQFAQADLELVFDLSTNSLSTRNCSSSICHRD